MAPWPGHYPIQHKIFFLSCQSWKQIFSLPSSTHHEPHFLIEVFQGFRNSFHLKKKKKSCTQIGSSRPQADTHNNKSVDRCSGRVRKEDTEIAESATRCHNNSGRDRWVGKQAKQRKHIWMVKKYPKTIFLLQTLVI